MFDRIVPQRSMLSLGITNLITSRSSGKAAINFEVRACDKSGFRTDAQGLQQARLVGSCIDQPSLCLRRTDRERGGAAHRYLFNHFCCVPVLIRNRGVADLRYDLPSPQFSNARRADNTKLLCLVTWRRKGNNVIHLPGNNRICSDILLSIDRCHRLNI